MKPQPDDPGIDDDDDESADATARKILWGVGIGATIVMGAILYACSPALAQHNPANPNHWYEVDCCSLNDCEFIAADMVAETPAGYVVTVRPGTHPKWPITRPMNLVLTYAYRDKKVRPSRDAFWHVCIAAGGAPLCLYVIGGGF